MKTKIALALGFIGLLGLALGFAGQSTAESIKTKIDFPFTVGGKALPAGEYDFSAINNDQEFRVQGEGKDTALVNVITRLAAGMHTTPQDAHLVFDVVGDKYALSEVWIPGVDGFVLQITKGKHTHKIVNVQR